MAEPTRFVAQGILAATVLVSGAAWAQPDAWPRKTLCVICPFAAGGATDIFARVFSQRMQLALRQNVVVDNRGGAGGVIGAELAIRAEADGHTLLFASDSPITIGPNLFRM